TKIGIRAFIFKFIFLFGGKDETTILKKFCLLHVISSLPDGFITMQSICSNKLFLLIPAYGYRSLDLSDSGSVPFVLLHVGIQRSRFFRFYAVGKCAIIYRYRFIGTDY